MSVGCVWGTDNNPPYCSKGPHTITFEKYSPNEKVTVHFRCRWCHELIRLDLPGNIVKVEPPPRTRGA